MELLDEPRITRHKLTVEQYHRMVEAGVLAPDARTELMDGEVIDMAPMGTRHRFMVMQLSRLLERAVGDLAHVSTQLPLRLDASNEPEPDLALLKPRADGYIDTMPTGADTLLVIEVSDATLAYDVRTKAPLYASRSVPEFWVVDLPGRVLRCFRAPQGDQWRDVQTLSAPGRMALPGLDGTSVDLTGLLQRLAP